MQLRELKDGASFRVVRTGKTAIKLGLLGRSRGWRVVQYHGEVALSDLNHQVEVEPITKEVIHDDGH